MHKIRTLLIDDEPNALSMLKGYLSQYTKNVEVIDTARSSEEGMEKILRLEPELVFLDISMPGVNGLDMLKNFKSRNFEIIFVTAFQDYSLDAFDVGAVHYLLKPISLVKLKEAVQRCSEIIRDRSQKASLPSPPSTLRITEAKSHSVVKIADIQYLEADSSYTSIVMKDGRTFTTSRNIKHFEEQLHPCGFFRIHKQYLVNLASVKSVTRGKGGYVHLENGDALEISYRKKGEFLEALDQNQTSL